jgi:pantoate--beta-alanine ligase
MSAPRVIRTIAEMRKVVADFRMSPKAEGKEPGVSGSVGFVPTMGYLHEGHASLLRRARQENGLVVLSVFVNPLQFGPGEDFERYPRDEKRDLEVAAACGVDIAFLPSADEMYPNPPLARVTVGEITGKLCGKSRPGHFDGVATVVTKLFNIVRPDRAYFGLKDAQQVAVVTQMVRDLNLPVEIVPCPTVREADGLALSSRNVYLGSREREQATILYRTLQRAGEWIAEGADAAELRGRMRRSIAESPIADTDYAEVVTWPDLADPPEGRPLRELDAPLLVALAVRFGKTRLIDNVIINPKEVTATCSGK